MDIRMVGRSAWRKAQPDNVTAIDRHQLYAVATRTRGMPLCMQTNPGVWPAGRSGAAEAKGGLVSCFPPQYSLPDGSRGDHGERCVPERFTEMVRRRTCVNAHAGESQIETKPHEATFGWIRLLVAFVAFAAVVALLWWQDASKARHSPPRYKPTPRR